MQFSKIGQARGHQFSTLAEEDAFPPHPTKGGVCTEYSLSHGNRKRAFGANQLKIQV